MRTQLTRATAVKRRAGPGRAGGYGFRKVLALILVAACGGLVQMSASDSPDVETRVKVAFIYNFVRFVEWPAHATSGPVRIGVLGRGDLDLPLQEMIRGKSVNGRAIE